MRTISLKLPDDLLAELSIEPKTRQVKKSSLIRERPAHAFAAIFDAASDTSPANVRH